jgi:hypothetical protein
VRDQAAVIVPRHATLLAVVGCGLAVAACGGASHRSAPKSNAQFAMARCMRSHGVSNFPDPRPGGGFTVVSAAGSSTLTVDGITFDGPAFESAIRTCKFFGGGTAPPPISAAQQQQMIAKARCIRTHGVPNFPDPTFGPGGEGAGINLGPGDNLQAPAVRRALKACAHVGTNIPGLGLG